MGWEGRSRAIDILERLQCPILGFWAVKVLLNGWLGFRFYVSHVVPFEFVIWARGKNRLPEPQTQNLAGSDTGQRGMTYLEGQGVLFK